MSAGSHHRRQPVEEGSDVLGREVDQDVAAEDDLAFPHTGRQAGDQVVAHGGDARTYRVVDLPVVALVAKVAGPAQR
jgi:hypothetical protein